MARCEVCGNESEDVLEVSVRGATFVFDTFECAIHRLALQCAHCGCRIIGHVVESDGRPYCCAHCALEQEHSELKERAQILASSRA